MISEWKWARWNDMSGKEQSWAGRIGGLYLYSLSPAPIRTMRANGSELVVIGSVSREMKEAFKVFMWLDFQVEDLKESANKGLNLFNSDWQLEHVITQKSVNDCLATAHKELVRARFLLGKSLGANYE